MTETRLPILNPVPGFNFNVFMFDTEGGLLSENTGEVLSSLGGLAMGVGKKFLFGSFKEVNGLNAEIEIEEYHEGGNNTRHLRFTKWGRFPNLVLRRGVTPNTDLWDWGYQVLYGSSAPVRKSGIILLNDRGGGIAGAMGRPTGLNLPVLDLTPIALWYFRGGLPERLQGPNLDAAQNEIAIETLEISHQGLMRIGPGMIPGAGDTITRLGL